MTTYFDHVSGQRAKYSPPRGDVIQPDQTLVDTLNERRMVVEERVFESHEEMMAAVDKLLEGK